MTYLFEVNLCVAAESRFNMFRPFLLPLRVFLRAQGIYVMRQWRRRFVGGVPQTAAGDPRLQTARRRETACGRKTVQ